MELEEDLNKPVELANQRQMSFNLDKCSVMRIGYNKMQSNHNMTNQQLPTTDQQRDLEIIITKELKWQKQTEKSCKRPTPLPTISCTKQRTDPPIIQILSQPMHILNMQCNSGLYI